MESRSFGLDVLRSVSVWMVMSAHVTYWFDPTSAGIFKVFIMPLFLGVEPFFVLGGFLAALSFQHLFEKNNSTLHFSDAKKYIARRWIRTLPNYFLFLAIYATAFSVVKADFSFDTNYLFFAQNLFWLAPNFFSVSWSLATQEWFYILLPLLMLLCFRIVPARLNANPIISAAIIMVLFSLFCRVAYIAFYSPENLEGELRRIAALRLDSIAIGVLIGYAYLARVKLFTQRLSMLFSGGILLVILLAYLRRWDVFSENTIVQLFYYPVFSTAIGLCIPYLYELPKMKIGFFRWLFEQTSKWSYSIYLSHVLFLDAMYLIAKRLHVDFLGESTAILMAIVWVLLTYTVAALLYKYFEMPCVKWMGRKK